MNRRPLGRTALSVSELGFGAAPIGNLYTAVHDDIARAAVDQSWDAGIRYFDTAPHYGLGLAERRLGAALAERPRAEYVISTKVGRRLVTNPNPTGSDLAEGFDVPDTYTRARDYSRDGAWRSLEASLHRLGLDRVDIALVHDPDEPDQLDQTISETIPALIALRDQGMITAVGVGMNNWQPQLRIVTETDVDTVMIAGRWTLLDRSAEPLLDACAERGIAVLAAAPFNSGLAAKPWPPDDATYDYRPVPPSLLARARAYARTCQQHGGELPAAALQFPLHHPAVAAVVTGIRTPVQARMDAAWMSADFSPAAWSALAAMNSPAAQ